MLGSARLSVHQQDNLQELNRDGFHGGWGEAGRRRMKRRLDPAGAPEEKRAEMALPGASQGEGGPFLSLTPVT